MNSFWEARFGCVVSVAGVIWAVREGTLHASLSIAALPVGPLEIACLGLLIWVHAKYRASVNMNR
jgi:hypothetical protein